MSDSILLESVGGGVARLTLNRPEKRNALNAALVRAVTEALDRAASDDSVRVVALAGAGDDFCAGADLAELESLADRGYEESLVDARSLAALFVKMRSHPRPLVALVQGRALAGGCGLATACDLVLARADAELGYPEVHLGFVPALVMTMLRRKVTEARAFELVALGSRVSAEEALSLGLVNRVFPVDAFESEAARYVSDLATRPPGAMRETKSLLYELERMSFERGLERAGEVNARARTSEECRTGVRAFLDKSGRKGRSVIPPMRGRGGSRRHLVWKTRILGVAVAVTLVGMYLNNPYVTGAALALLVVGMLLRFLPEPRAPREPEEPDQD